VLIARDEEAVLDRCLTSLRGLVDEIVVVDTGSTDRTADIARAHGATVGHFAWTNDFAAARNHALELATTPWRLVIDADEWIAERDAAAEVLEAVAATAPTFVGLIGISSVKSADLALPDDLPAPLPRLLPSTVRYEGRIHEQPATTMPFRTVPLRLGHDGYNDEALAAKGDRNRLLLEAALREEPDNPYLWYQLASEYMARDRLDDAARHYIHAYNLIRPLEGSAGQPRTYWLMIVVRLLRVLQFQERFDEALAVCSQELNAWPETSSFFVMFGIIAWGKAGHDYGSGAPSEAAAELVELAIDCWNRVLELGDDHGAFGAIPERPTVLAARGLVEIYTILGRESEAERYRALAAA
jgi:hypothetical protein